MTKAWPSAFMKRPKEGNLAPAYWPDLPFYARGHGLIVDSKDNSIYTEHKTIDHYGYIFNLRHETSPELGKNNPTDEEIEQSYTAIHRTPIIRVGHFNVDGKDYTKIEVAELINPSFFGKEYAEKRLKDIPSLYNWVKFEKAKTREERDAAATPTPSADEYDQLWLNPEYGKESRLCSAETGFLIEGAYEPKETLVISEERKIYSAKLTDEEIQAFKNIDGERFKDFYLGKAEKQYATQPIDIDLEKVMPWLQPVQKNKSKTTEKNTSASTSKTPRFIDSVKGHTPLRCFVYGKPYHDPNFTIGVHPFEEEGFEHVLSHGITPPNVDDSDQNAQQSTVRMRHFMRKGKPCTAIIVSEFNNPSFFGEEYANGTLGETAGLIDKRTGKPVEGAPNPEDYPHLRLSNARDQRRASAVVALVLGGHYTPKNRGTKLANGTGTMPTPSWRESSGSFSAEFDVQMSAQEIQNIKNIAGPEFKHFFLEDGPRANKKGPYLGETMNVDMGKLLPSIQAPQQSQGHSSQPSPNSQRGGNPPSNGGGGGRTPPRQRSTNTTSTQQTASANTPSSDSSSAGHWAALVGGTALAGAGLMMKPEQKGSAEDKQKSEGWGFAKIATVAVGVTLAGWAAYKFISQGKGTITR